MADDINLPNLVSHLQVNLQRTSGIVADAARQGSTVGAALGESLQQRVQAATNNIPPVVITDDSNQFDRDLDRIRRDLQRLGDQRIGVDISVDDAVRQLNRLEPHIDRLATTHPDINVRAFVADAAANLADIRAAARRLPTQVDISVDLDAGAAIVEAGLLDRVLSKLGNVGSTVSTALLPVVGTLAKAAAVAGAAAPLLAGVASAVESILPASAVATTGLVAVQLAAGATKLAMVGVGDAVKLALDPGADADKLSKALDKLAPEARAFVVELQGMNDEFKSLQQGVQNRFFKDFDTELQQLSKTVLPEVRGALDSSATSLNLMAVGAADAAEKLGTSGVLGTALDSATGGLRNLVDIPGQATTAFGQLAAAAGPAFERITSAVARVATEVSGKLSAAFESGDLEDAINAAVDVIVQLGRVGKNVFDILGNVMSAASQDGGGLFDTLETITGALRDATSTQEFQGALGALSDTVAKLAETAAPLLIKAIRILGPVIEELAPPVQKIIDSLGTELGRVMDELGPVLGGLAGVFGELILAVDPFIGLAGDLLVAILPSLIPLFATLKDIIEQSAPFFQQLAENLGTQLVPLFERLAPSLEDILPAFVQLAEEVFPKITEVLVELSPLLGDLAVTFGDILVQMAPIVGQLLMFAAVLSGLVIEGVADVLIGLTRLADLGFKYVSDIVYKYVIPSIQGINQLLHGDFRGALNSALTITGKITGSIGDYFSGMKTRITSILGGYLLAVSGLSAETMSDFKTSTAKGIASVVSYFLGIPGKIRSAIGNQSSLLYGIGQSILRGLINGVVSMIPSLISKFASITASIPDWKGPKKKDASLLTPAGKSIINGLIAGIDGSTAALKSKLTSVTNTIQRAIDVNSSNKSKTGGLGSLLATVKKDNNALLSLAKTRDAVAAKMKTAQTALDTVLKARTKEAADISSGVLAEGNIVQGNSVVNGVSAITVGLQLAVKKAAQFAASIAALKKAGLRSDLLQQIADAGVSGGAATADALAKATPAELKRINDLQAQLAKAATSTGATVAGALYDSGVKAAQGLVDGLKKQQGAIEKQMEKIGEAMLKAIRKALDMHSPSRKLRAVGSLAMAGLPQGFEDMRASVARSAASVASVAVAAASGAAARVAPFIPAPGALSAATAGAGGGGDTHNTFNLYGTETSPDGILNALSWRGLVGR